MTLQVFKMRSASLKVKYLDIFEFTFRFLEWGIQFSTHIFWWKRLLWKITIIMMKKKVLIMKKVTILFFYNIM